MHINFIHNSLFNEYFLIEKMHGKYNVKFKYGIFVTPTYVSAIKLPSSGSA